MTRERKTWWLYKTGLFLLALVVVMVTRRYPFYWDNIVQLSVPANWFYEHGFGTLFLPDEISTGHPPFVGMYLALLWKVFGRSLLISHLAMLPFVFGLLWQLHEFIRNIGVKEQALTVILLGFVVLDATFLAQLSLITFDIIHLFLFFLGVNAIITRQNKLLAIAFAFLTIVSLRAAISAGGLLIFNVLLDHFHQHKKFRIQNYTKFIPGILTLALFLVLFKLHKGWMIHNTVSQAWSDSSALASGTQVIRNTVLFGWRLVDFGRIGALLLFGVFLFTVSDRAGFVRLVSRLLFLLILSQFCLFFANRKPLTKNGLLTDSSRCILPCHCNSPPKV